MTGLPPFDVGVVQVTTAFALPGTAVTPDGAEGGPSGVTAADATDEAPSPSAFVAMTVKVYAMPSVKPATVAVVAPVVVAVNAPGRAVTV